jgi:hypothetical protein
MTISLPQPCRPVQFAASQRVTSPPDPSFIEVEGHRTVATGGTEDETGRTG